MRKNKSKPNIGGRRGLGHYLFFAATAIVLSAMAVIGAIDISVPERIAFIVDGESVSPDDICFGETAATDAHGDGVTALVTDYDAEAKLGPLTVKNVGARAYGDIRLVPCGTIFGIKFFTKGVMIVGTSEIETSDGKLSPAQKAGLTAADVIESVNGIEVNTVEEIAQITEASGGEVLTVVFERDGLER